MEIKIQNITWNFNRYNQWDEDFLGFSYVGIPPNMMKRFIKECKWDDDIRVPPHYFEEDLENLDLGSEHECWNADTQIVLMKWLHDKRRNYQLDYRGGDPFWIFHDHCHSQNDVHGYEVSGIYAYTEYVRILEGAQMAQDHGILIKPETAIEVIKAWQPRFGSRDQQISERDFYPFFKDEREEEFEFLTQIM